MKAVKKLCVFGIGIWCLSNAPAQAALLSTNDSVFGGSAITLDTETGLEWLDLPFSLNLSYNSISTQFGSGGSFSGFRHASTTEVEALFIAAGIPNIGNGNGSVANIAPSQALIALVGATSFQGIYPGTMGITGTSRFAGSHRSGLLDFYWNGDISVYNASTDTYQTGDTVGFDNVGHWLVREPSSAAVPEPTTVLGLSTAAVGLFLKKRNCKQS